MSTSRIAAGITFWVGMQDWIWPRRGSGTATMPTLGSMVQKG